MDRKIFNKVFAKYQKKDYFSDKEFIRMKLIEAKHLNIKVTLSEVKAFLKDHKEKTFIMMVERITEFKQGKKYPLRERFTWACIKAMGLS